MKSGLQLYSVRQAAEKSLLGTLAKVAEMGYDSVQFAGFFEKEAAAVKRTLDKHGLQVAGSHTPLEDLTGDKLQETIQFNQGIGNHLLICPFIEPSYRESAESYEKTAKLLNEIGEKCQAEGMQFAYHHHDFEFEKMKGKTGFDILFENTNPDFVKIELDMYWAIYAGHDPFAIMEKYQSRILSLHVKDMISNHRETRSIEIGSGQLAIPDLLQTAQQYDVEWAIVEQEHFDMAPLQSARQNSIALQKILHDIHE